MKKYFVLFLTLLLSSVSLADKVTEQEALQKAQKFFKDKRIISRKSLTRGSNAEQQPSATPEDYYVFNVEDKGGFVIISGDDRTPEVLGYADSGNIDMDNLPPNLKGWLEGYSKQIKAIKNSGIAGSRATSRTVTRAPKTAIAPLVTTKWGQDDPYNMNCPDYIENENHYKCATGCTATAMAQIMYYHRAESTNKTTAKIPGYYGSKTWGDDNRQITAEAIPAGAKIDWDNMLDIYDGSETAIQKEAVANLMYYCGAALTMDYGPAFFGGSGAFSFDVPIALKRYFDYSEHTTLVWRQDYTEENWDDLIYSELSKGNPIYYSGSNSEAAHAFVCDGYDGNGYYHINWGWDGLSDSFFLLSALNPNQQGTGGSTAGYNDGQCALIGAVPNGEIIRLTSQSVSLTGNTSFILSEKGDNITVPVRWGIQNMTGTSCNFNHAIGLYHNGELVKVLEKTGTSEMFIANQEKTIDASLNIETNLSSGIYQLYALSRSQGEEKWFRNDNSSDCFITLVIKDGSMSFCVGKPAVAENVISFADDEVKRICVENWDTDGDGEISYDEAASVTDFGDVFARSIIRTFDEAQFFTGITSFGLTSYDGYGCPSLTSIKLPPSVTTIKDGAFYSCTSLTSIEIPASVKEIGHGAFYCCFSLQEVVLHEGLEKINDEAFYKCAISSIHFPASLSTLNGIIWYGCENLNVFYVDDNSSHYCAIDGILFSKDRKKLIYFPCMREGNYSIPEGTETIGACAFDCSKLEAVTIPTSVTCIERSGFDSMSNLHEITIPSTVTTIEEMAFYGCVSLERVSFEGSRSTIPDGMFMNCWSLKKVKFPDNLSLIGPHAFQWCSSLLEISIPSTIISIDDYAFAGSGLRRVKSYMQSPCAINSTVFEEISSNPILFVPEESLTAYKETDNWKDFAQILSLEEKFYEQYAVLDNGVLSFYYDTIREERGGEVYEMFPNWIEKAHFITKVIFDTSFANARPTSTSQWFYELDNLTEILGLENLNTSEVTEMSSMFVRCSSLTSIDLSSFNTTKVTNMYAMFSGCSSLTSIDLSNLDMSKVTSMDAMFWGCSNLKAINLPNDLTFIDSWQFLSCSSLTDISIPASVTSIGDNAFAGCTSLVEIIIPAKVTSIGDNAFSYSCLTKVTSLMQTPCGISSTVFENVSNNATLYVPAGCKAAYEAADYWKDFKKILGPSSNLIYMVDGDEYRSYEIEHGSAITPEPAPTKETYVFSGWSEIPETMPDHDVIVTGSFERHFDVGHVVNVVNLIMNANATPEDIALYDMNNDNELNIGDIILVLKSILNSGGGGSNLARSRTENSVDLAQYTAAQFILSVADGTSVKDVHLVKSMEDSHQIIYSKKGANTYYVVVYSLSNQLMKPENGNIIVVETDGGNNTSFTMGNMIVALQNGETERYQGHYGGTTGIREFENEESPTIIYDLKGNRIDGSHGLKNGFYIINGKKVVVK